MNIFIKHNIKILFKHRYYYLNNIPDELLHNKDGDDIFPDYL